MIYRRFGGARIFPVNPEWSKRYILEHSGLVVLNTNPANLARPGTRRLGGVQNRTRHFGEKHTFAEMFSPHARRHLSLPSSARHMCPDFRQPAKLVRPGARQLSGGLSPKNLATNHISAPANSTLCEGRSFDYLTGFKSEPLQVGTPRGAPTRRWSQQ